MIVNGLHPVFRLSAATLLIGLLGGTAAAQDVDPRIAKVMSDWQKRQEKTQRVRYEVSGEETVPKGAHNDLRGEVGGPRATESLPPRDLTSPIKKTLLIDFAGGRYRIDLERQKYDPGSDRLYSAVNTVIFDGKEIKGWRPRHLNTHPLIGVKPGEPEISVGRGNLSGARFTFGDRAFFAGHGSIASSEAQMGAGKLRVCPDTDLLSVHGQGVHQGRACLVLRTPARRGQSTSFDEYWIDTERESALVRQLYYIGKVARHEISIEYQPTEHGWLPKRWSVAERYTGITANGMATYLCKMNVDRFELEPSIQSSDFQIEERPRMIVSINTYSTAKPGLPSADDTQSEVFSIDPQGRRQLIATNMPPKSYRWWYLLAGTLAALLLLVIWWRRRHLRKQRQTVDA